jgi:hypothetical protein
MSDNLFEGLEDGQKKRPAPNGDGRDPAEAENAEDLAEALLLPNPATLAVIGQMLVIPVVTKPGALEFFRTHPDLRLTLKMVTPNKGEIGAHTYAVLPAMEGVLARYKFEPYVATLYPIVIDSRPLTYKLVIVKPPPAGRDWDNYNLTRKLALDMAVDKWIAMRSIRGGYEACDPDPEAKFPDPVFPDYTASEWLQKSLGVTDLIIRDESHPVLKEIRHL